MILLHRTSGTQSQTQSVEVGDIVASVSFNLVADVVALSALEVLASRADETTPVAYTNVSKEEMEIRLGSQDIPMILNTTPSVYATQQGGGVGDLVSMYVVSTKEMLL